MGVMGSLIGFWGPLCDPMGVLGSPMGFWGPLGSVGVEVIWVWGHYGGF